MDWSVIIALLLSVSVCAEDRWVWKRSQKMQDNKVLTPKIQGRVNSRQHNNVLSDEILGRVNSLQDNAVLIPKILGRVNSQQRNNVLTPEILQRVNEHYGPHQKRAEEPVLTLRTIGPGNSSPSTYLNSRFRNRFPPFFFPFMSFGGFMGLQQGVPVSQTPFQQKVQREVQQQALLLKPSNHDLPLPEDGPNVQQQNLQRVVQQPLLSRPPSHALPLPGDGTTKTRVTEDTAFHIKSVVEDGDKYTTIDKHQSEQQRTQPLPRTSSEHLGGLHPDEVFYADEDLLIIKGGGFNNDKFEEPSQMLDDSHSEDPEFGHDTQQSSLVLPNPDLEYNGNIPAILPPPSTGHRLPAQTDDQSHFAVFMESPSTRTNTMTVYIPFVYSLDDSRNFYNSLDLRSQFIEREPNFNYLYVHQSAEQHPSLHSLIGDTAVNYLEPRPSLHQHAELIDGYQHQLVLPRQQQFSHQTPQVVYHQPYAVYQYHPEYPYRAVYDHQQTAEVYRSPTNFFYSQTPIS